MNERIEDLNHALRNNNIKDESIDGTITSLKEVSVNVQNDIKKVQGDVSNLKSILSTMGRVEEDFITIQKKIE